jgi:hypothetical protein
MVNTAITLVLIKVTSRARLSYRYNLCFITTAGLSPFGAPRLMKLWRPPLIRLHPSLIFWLVIYFSDIYIAWRKLVANYLNKLAQTFLKVCSSTTSHEDNITCKGHTLIMPHVCQTSWKTKLEVLCQTTLDNKNWNTWNKTK